MVSVSGDGWEPLGLLLLYVFVPVHTATLIWFIRRRKFFPIVGRYPSLTIGMMVIMTPILGWFGHLFQDPNLRMPCWVEWTFLGPLSTSFLPIITLRAALLLFQFEITADLAIAEKLRGIARERFKQQGKPMGLPTEGMAPSLAGTWSPSWWTTHRHYMRATYVRRVFIALVIIYGVVDVSTTNMIADTTSDCYVNGDMEQYQLIQLLYQTIFLVPFGLLLLSIVWKLRKHSQDGYGLMDEFKWLSPILFIPLPVGMSVVTLSRASASLYRSSIIWCVYMISWGFTCLWPLNLTYRHQRQMTERLAELTMVTKLEDLLQLPNGYESFLAFARAEFNSESVLFWRRIIDFREGILNYYAAATATPAMATSPHPNSSLSPSSPDTNGAGHGANGVTSAVTPSPLLQTLQLPPSAVSQRSGHLSLPGGASNSIGSLPIAMSHSSNEGGATGTAGNNGSNGTNNNGGATLAMSMEEAQQHLLSSLIEANTIFAHYIDNGAPNELNLSQTMRLQVRATLDNVAIRAATANNHYISQQVAPVAPTLPAATSSVAGSLPSVPSPHHQHRSSMTLNNNGNGVAAAINGTTNRTASPVPTNNKDKQLECSGNGSGRDGNATGPIGSPVPGSSPRPGLTLKDSNDGITTVPIGIAAAVAAVNAADGGSGNESSVGAPTVPSPHHHTPPLPVRSATLPVRLITRQGMSVSSLLSVEEAHTLEIDIRDAFNDCQNLVSNLLDINAFARFRASDVFSQLIMAGWFWRLSGMSSPDDHTIRAPASHPNPNAVHPLPHHDNKGIPQHIDVRTEMEERAAQAIRAHLQPPPSNHAAPPTVPSNANNHLSPMQSHPSQSHDAPSSPLVFGGAGGTFNGNHRLSAPMSLLSMNGGSIGGGGLRGSIQGGISVGGGMMSQPSMSGSMTTGLGFGGRHLTGHRFQIGSYHSSMAAHSAAAGGSPHGASANGFPPLPSPSLDSTAAPALRGWPTPSGTTTNGVNGRVLTAQRSTHDLAAAELVIGSLRGSVISGTMGASPLSSVTTSLAVPDGVTITSMKGNTIPPLGNGHNNETKTATSPPVGFRMAMTAASLVASQAAAYAAAAVAIANSNKDNPTHPIHTNMNNNVSNPMITNNNNNAGNLTTMNSSANTTSTNGINLPTTTTTTSDASALTSHGNINGINTTPTSDPVPNHFTMSVNVANQHHQHHPSIVNHDANTMSITNTPVLSSVVSPILMSSPTNTNIYTTSSSTSGHDTDMSTIGSSSSHHDARSSIVITTNNAQKPSTIAEESLIG